MCRFDIKKLTNLIIQGYLDYGDYVKKSAKHLYNKYCSDI